MKILLTGSSGFIGSKLRVFLLLAGHRVVRLVRDKEDLASDAIFWDPVHGEINRDDFEGFDAVVHLAGANVASGRWTKKRKHSIFLSRCRDTWLLSQILCRLYSPPKVMISASATGIYGDRGEDVLTEESGPGSGFIPDLCQKWERATDCIESRGTRVVHTRFGAVLGAKGGMLKKMVPLFKWGLGGKLGSGKQKISWIGIDDLIGGIDHCIKDERISGPVNFVGPEAISQAEFARLLAKHLGRPAFWWIPAWVLKCLFGEMAEVLFLSSQNVIPKKLLASGYRFSSPDLNTLFTKESV